MEVTFFQKNLSKAEEGAFFDYLNRKKLQAIETLLQKFSSDATSLKITIEKFDKHNAFQVEFYLNLPTKAIIAVEASHQISKAIDLSRDRLLAQLRKHLESLREKRVHRSLKDHHSMQREATAEFIEELT